MHPIPATQHSPGRTSSPATAAPLATPSGTAYPARSTDRALTVLRFTLAALFVVAGTATLVGAPEIVVQFGTIANATGLGAWFRLTTGLLEVLGGVLLGVRAAAGVGAVLLGMVITGAALTHVLVLGDAPTAPAVLLAALAVVAYAHRAAIRVFAAALERNL